MWYERLLDDIDAPVVAALGGRESDEGEREICDDNDEGDDGGGGHGEGRRRRVDDEALDDGDAECVGVL